ALEMVRAGLGGVDLMQKDAGIVADAVISARFESGLLASPRPLDPDQIQPASLDLRLGAKAYRVRASFMPGPGTPVIEKLERLKLHEIDLTAGAVLETGCVYIRSEERRVGKQGRDWWSQD